MKAIHLVSFFLICYMSTTAQHMGMVRKNYISTYYDTLLNINIDVLDSSTIRLGSVNTTTGLVTNVGPEYNAAISLAGATINPYANQYYISDGYHFLTFDMGSGNIIANPNIAGPFQTAAFQNFRFNASDTIIYGLVPNNFYSTVYDSITMTSYQVLDSSHIRFASLNPVTGQYSLIGNVILNNMYTLAGNSIDPHQMVYYYSAVDTFVGVDLYTGNIFSQPAIQLPADTYFENFTYSCADTAIYGLARKNYYSTYYDSLLQMTMTVFDSATSRLSKIDPNTGVVTFISPTSIGFGGTLNGSSFIDPVTMTYYFSTGADIVGVSLQTGLITSSVAKTFQAGAMYYDMMRSTQNCYGALKVRQNNPSSLPSDLNTQAFSVTIKPNPATDYVTFQSTSPITHIEIRNLNGQVVIRSNDTNINISNLNTGVYVAKVYTRNGNVSTSKLVKQ
jgi:hypothetical protein